MLELKNITLRLEKAPESRDLLHDISLHLPSKHFGAIVGPSGCGKSTLLKAIAGVVESSDGSIYWQQRDLAREDLAPSEIGYVPQFGIAYEFLNIRENVEAALNLRVGGLSRAQRDERVTHILQRVGLDEIADRQVRVLSGGQRRRLALALEMVSDPALLLCDEVTSGLDPKAEEEIVKLMHQLSQTEGRIVLSVTHSLRHLHLYDSVVVLYQGSVVFHGSHRFLLCHFNVDTPEQVFPKLTTKPVEEWHELWLKSRRIYDESMWSLDEKYDMGDHWKKISRTRKKEVPKQMDSAESVQEGSSERKATVPGVMAQFFVLFARRWKIFIRDRNQIWLQLGLMFGFPCLVVIFALKGLPQIQNLTLEQGINPVQQLSEANRFIIQSTQVGSLVSGLVMFQVVLLTLMGSNNSAREVASERSIFEKEKLAGLSPTSYIASKAAFLFAMVAAQSIWMAVFVNWICHFPGDLLVQIALLLAVNGAMTAVCLGISSLVNSPEKASLISIYLVGFQLPLSGAVLALPDPFGWLTRPFIVAYWSWSGILQTMRDTRFYDVVHEITQTDLSAISLCLWALGFHAIIGVFLAYIGCKQSRWE